MGMRFKFLAAVYLLLMLIAYNTNELRPFGNVGDVFVGLASLLVFVIIGLWPNSSRGDRVDRAMAGSNWSDRIDFDRLPRE